MLAYDITNPKSFDSLESWRQEFLVQAGPSDGGSFPFVVLGNKVDKEVERRVTKSKATQWCKSKGSTGSPLPHLNTSAKDAVQVESAFLEAAKLALKREQTGADDIFIPETINLNGQQAKQGGGGCC